MSRKREALEYALARKWRDDSLVEDGDNKWVCLCQRSDGTIESSYWMTEDGAYEAEAELERIYPGAVCVVFLSN